MSDILTDPLLRRTADDLLAALWTSRMMAVVPEGYTEERQIILASDAIAGCIESALIGLGLTAEQIAELEALSEQPGRAVPPFA